MKKILTAIVAVMMAAVCCFGFTACGGKKDDLATVKKNGKLVVGVTIYEPMDYIDEDSGEWVGFDAELAKMFAESLEVNCQIVIITWSNKVAELNSNQIDLVWNGMTATDELGESIDFSVSYAKNAQVAVVKSDSAIATKEQVKSAKVAVEDGSAGNKVATAEGMTNVTPLTAQVDALNEVTSGASDVAIIDLTMARSVVGKGNYTNLKILEDVTYEEEVFAVGLRKGSNLKAKLDEFLKKAYKDGTMAALLEKYEVALNVEELSK